jgi:hypothetical protein
VEVFKIIERKRMATTHETIYTHTCDLCGTEKPEAELAHMFSAAPSFTQRVSPKQVDVCADCAATRPIADAVAFLAGAEITGGRMTTVSARVIGEAS